MSKGIVILAQNTDTVDYVSCAETLARSIYQTMPNAKVSLITNNPTSRQLFDKVIKLPHGDQSPNSDWKLQNDWQVYEASPYDHTIKLEADMYLPRTIDHWWDVFKLQDVVVCTTIRNFKQEISDVRTYRKFIDDNKLPNCYNSITYFNKSKLAEKFFSTVRDIFENWEKYKIHLKCNIDEIATTDWAYAIASRIIGEEKTTLPKFTEMSMIHMKRFINNLHTEKWTDSLVYEISPHSFRVNTVPQLFPFHYHIKDFYKEIERAFNG